LSATGNAPSTTWQPRGSHLQKDWHQRLSSGVYPDTIMDGTSIWVETGNNCLREHAALASAYSYDRGEQKASQHNAVGLSRRHLDDLSRRHGSL